MMKVMNDEEGGSGGLSDLSISMAQDLNVAGTGFKLSQRPESKIFTQDVLEEIKAE
jgi:hypothetical protein